MTDQQEEQSAPWPPGGFAERPGGFRNAVPRWRPPDLIAFITAQLDEDEAAADAGARRVGMPWHVEPQPGTPGGLVVDELGLVGTTGGRYAADHIARHDPARVLREVSFALALMEDALRLNGGWDLPGLLVERAEPLDG